MKKITLLMLTSAISLLTLAQGKLTADAQWRIARQKAQAMRLETEGQMKVGKKGSDCGTWVVEVAEKNVAETFEQMRAAGATVCSKLGHLAVISIPFDSLESLQRIDGVLRIDKGHKGRKKSDVTRIETHVGQLNGTTLPAGATAYTGKGVTVCLIDAGFDFQHPAFKDADGLSRIKCIYMMGDNGGHKFTYNDPEVGEITFPGSVYDTPELISTLTTDNEEEYHGTHTAGIAAGSLSPQGFGGMAPEADLVLIPLNDVEVEGLEEEDEYVELALSFASAYAQQSGQPMVLSGSLNSHGGPHDGTSMVTKAIEAASQSLIPVFSAGNEGGYPIHLYQEFTSAKPSVNTILLAIAEGETKGYEYMANVSGYTRCGDEVSVQLTLKSVNPFSGKLNTLWTSEKCTVTTGGEDAISLVSSEEDATLAKYFDGEVGVAAIDNGDGQLSIHAMVDGDMEKLYLFQLTVGGAPGTQLDVWDELAGFGGREYFGLSGLVDGNSDMSAGDWTSTDRVVSVGAYCANVLDRLYDGTTTDTSNPKDEDEEPMVLDDVAWYSSYGTSFNGVSQPTICAPGANIVSSVSHYYFDASTVADDMQWQGYPYSSESGTSMSCPAVSGIIALWLQAKSDLTLDDIKDVLRNTSRTDSYTVKNTDHWGYGKIDAAAGIDYITNGSAIRTIEYTTLPDVVYDLQGRRINSKPRAGVYIYKGKKMVVK